MNSSSLKSITIFTDGSALKNSSQAPAGWACYFVEKDILKSGSFHSTNNVAELFAISYAFWYCINVFKLSSSSITIKTDSEYSIKILTGTNKAKANLKLINGIKALIAELKKSNCSITYKHVDAHTGGTDEDSVNNDKVDKEARRQATILKKKDEKNSEQ